MSKVSFEDIVERSKGKAVQINVHVDSQSKYTPQSNDALFHIPLLAVVVGQMAYVKKYKLTTEILGTITGAVLAKTFKGYKGSGQKLEFSVTLRRRTAEALTFLEGAGLVKVNKTKISLTPRGRAFFKKLAENPRDIGQISIAIWRNYTRVMTTGLELL